MSDRVKCPPMQLIAGPCVIEDEGLVLEVATELKRQLAGLIQKGEIELTFKASFDKANRTSISSFRGPGMQEGLKILEKVKSKLGLPLLTDFHTPEQAAPVAEVVDFLQIPAFLCRQTDMIVAGATEALKRGKKLNIKKGQFLAPWDAKNILEKTKEMKKELGISPGEDKPWVYLTERGVCHGYNTLVVDMISFQAMQSFGAKVIYDATHSIQVPGAAPGGKSSGGKREYLEVLARAAMAAGADGLFMECHPNPALAKSDGPNAFYLDRVGAFIDQLVSVKKLVSTMPRLIEK